MRRTGQHGRGSCLASEATRQVYRLPLARLLSSLSCLFFFYFASLKRLQSDSRRGSPVRQRPPVNNIGDIFPMSFVLLRTESFEEHFIKKRD